MKNNIFLWNIYAFQFALYLSCFDFFVLIKGNIIKEAFYIKKYCIILQIQKTFNLKTSLTNHFTEIILTVYLVTT